MLLHCFAQAACGAAAPSCSSRARTARDRDVWTSRCSSMARSSKGHCFGVTRTRAAQRVLRLCAVWDCILHSRGRRHLCFTSPHAHKPHTAMSFHRSGDIAMVLYRTGGEGCAHVTIYFSCSHDKRCHHPGGHCGTHGCQRCVQTDTRRSRSPSHRYAAPYCT